MEKGKDRVLWELKEKGFPIPEFLGLSQKILEENKYHALVEEFLKAEHSYIVRSSVEGEDGSSYSYAGHFVSSGKLKPSEVLESIHQLFIKNKEQQQKLCPQGKTNLLLQQYIDSDLGGVCFAPWQYFYHHMLVEWSSEGAQKVVEGKKDGEIILEVRAEGYKEDWHKELASHVQRLLELYKIPLDIEWGKSTEGKIYIFQVRPITAPVAGIKTASLDQFKSQKKIFEQIKEGEWSRTGFSESLGVLSPLSFSLLKNLFLSAQPFLKNLGCKTSQDIFFARAKNGQIYSHAKTEQSYFQPHGISGAFRMAFKKSFLQKEIVEGLPKVSQDFSFQNLEIIFRWWLAANMYASSKNISFWGIQGEYELSWPTSVEFPKLGKTDWESLRIFLKKLFISHLSEIKNKISPQYIFGNFDSHGQIQPADYGKVEDSLVIYPASFHQENTQAAVVVVPGKGQMPCEVIFQPELFKGSLPENKVIIAPYFDNRWVDQIPHLKGIILEQGGSLSHSAIVAREYQIPYIIKVSNAVKIYKKESSVDLSSF